MKYFSLILIFCLQALVLHSQDTFSICAVDSTTGEVGSAGASCIDDIVFPGSGGAKIISDVLPGRGVIHTQSYWNAANQQNARTQMLAGNSPTDIIGNLQDADAEGNPAIRQYGIVDLSPTGSPRSAGFTGANCFDYKNHITGKNYSIQGNILLGQQILDSIESRFLKTEGPLAKKLMAALQGAKVIGADTRCTDDGTSSLSAFLRVAKKDDTAGEFYLDLNVPSCKKSVDPIDSLQVLYNAWSKANAVINLQQGGFTVVPNPAYSIVTIGLVDEWAGSVIEISDTSGKLVLKQVANAQRTEIDISRIPNGQYFVSCSKDKIKLPAQKLIIQK